jgi:glyoxylate carboligase
MGLDIITNLFSPKSPSIPKVQAATPIPQAQGINEDLAALDINRQAAKRRGQAASVLAAPNLIAPVLGKPSLKSTLG